MDYRKKLTPQMYDYDQLSLRWLPNIMFFNQPNFRSKTVNTDSFGLRFNNQKDLNNTNDIIDYKLKNNKKNYLLMGSSTSFGVGTCLDEFTISSLLESNKDFNVINLSGRALNGFQEIISLFSHFGRLKNISKIIIFSGINDFYLNKNFENFFPGNIFQNNLFLEKTNKFNLGKLDKLKKLVKSFYSQKSNINTHFPKIDLKDIIYRNFGIYKMISDYLKAPIIYFLQPSIYWCKQFSSEEKKLISQIKEDKHHKMVHNIKSKENHIEYSSLLNEVSKSLNIEFYDLNNFIEENSLEKDWLFADTLHLTDQGNKLVSNFIEEKI